MIVISESSLHHIFNHVDLLILLKLRPVSSDWKKFIENDFKIWSKLICSSEEIKPWKYQLIQLKYPTMSCSDYDNLSNDQYRELFFTYINWRKVDDHAYSLVAFQDSQFFDNSDNAITHIDTWGNFIVFVGKSENSVVLFDVNTGELLKKIQCFNFESFSVENKDESNEENAFKICRLRIFQLEVNRLAFCLATDSAVFFWDVDQEISIPTPEILQEKSKYRPINISRGCDCSIYLTLYNLRKITIVKCHYDITSQNIIAQKLITLNPPGNFYNLTFGDIYLQKKTILMIFRYQKSSYLMQVSVSENLESPMEINLNEKKYIKIIFEDFERLGFLYGLCVPNFNTVMGYYPQESRLDVMTKFKLANTNRYNFIEKSYILPAEFGKIIELFFYMNNLYLLTEKDLLIIYKLKNVKHLMHLALDKLQPKVIEIPGITMINSVVATESKSKPFIIISKYFSTKFLTLHFN